MKTRAVQLLLRDINPYLKTFLPETRNFLYSGLYVKRRKRIKYSLRIIAFEKRLVQNDIIVTVTDEFKSFSEINTGIFQYRYKTLKNLSLSSVARLKRDILFRTSEILYLTHRFMDFRNLTLRMSSNQYYFLSFNNYVRLLNKKLFFSLSSKLSYIPFKFPSLIMYHFKKFLRLRVYYLGFRLILKKNKMNSLLISSSLTKHVINVRRKLKIYSHVNIKKHLKKNSGLNEFIKKRRHNKKKL